MRRNTLLALIATLAALLTQLQAKVTDYATQDNTGRMAQYAQQVQRLQNVTEQFKQKVLSLTSDEIDDDTYADLQCRAVALYKAAKRLAEMIEADKPEGVEPIYKRLHDVLERKPSWWPDNEPWPPQGDVPLDPGP